MTEVNQVDINKIEAVPMNFVIGKERSGTTLLQVMLNAHPNIVAPPESRFIIMFYFKYGSKTKWTEKDISEFCNSLYVEKIFKEYWNIDRQKLYSSLIEVKEKLSYSLLCKLVFYHFESAKDFKIFVDKNPLYYYFIPELSEIYPSAKFIHIVRDYRANIVSHKRVITVELNTPDMAYRWLKVNELIEKSKAKAPLQWLTIKYESLVTDPNGVMKQVCEFLNVPFDKNMTEAHNTKLFPSFYEKTDKDERFKQMHGKVFEPITTAFVDEWKGVLTQKELDIIEFVTGGYAEKAYGYKRYSENKNFHISSFRLFIVRVKYFLIMVYFRGVLKHRWAYYVHRYFIIHILRSI